MTLAWHFQSREIGGNAQFSACCSSFSSGSVCKTIAVDGGRKGVRGGGCGRPASGGLSFSITKSVATKWDKISGGRYIPTHCLRLPANVTATLSPPIRRMDDGLYDRSGDKHCHKTAWGCIVLAYSVIAWGILCSRHEGSGVAVQATVMRRYL